MNQLEKMAKKKKDLGLILAHFSQIRAAKLIFFFLQKSGSVGH